MYYLPEVKAHIIWPITPSQLTTGVGVPIMTAAKCISPVALFFLLVTLIASNAGAQTFTVLHDFTGGSDGATPAVGLTMDAAGHLFGTTASGGSGHGVVFELKRAGSGWIFAPIYTFRGGNDGSNPESRVTIGPNGSLYGVTVQGGGAPYCAGGCGTAYNLRPPARSCSRSLCPWNEHVIYAFAGLNSMDALAPYADLAFDSAGNAYGAGAGGLYNHGAVFQLTPANGGWTESVIYNFAGNPNDGSAPFSGPIIDSTGALNGVTASGGLYNQAGVAYHLVRSGGGWVETVTHNFMSTTDGRFPNGMVMDSAGNLYGGTRYEGPHGNGTVWQLTHIGDLWNFTVLFDGQSLPCGINGTVSLDAAGNLYGVTCNTVFKLSPNGGGWSYQQLYHFTDGGDGGSPNGSVVVDASGNIYGTAYYGGTGNCFRGCGVVWQITP